MASTGPHRRARQLVGRPSVISVIRSVSPARGRCAYTGAVAQEFPDESRPGLWLKNSRTNRGQGCVRPIRTPCRAAGAVARGLYIRLVMSRIRRIRRAMARPGWRVLCIYRKRGVGQPCVDFERLRPAVLHPSTRQLCGEGVVSGERQDQARKFAWLGSPGDAQPAREFLGEASARTREAVAGGVRRAAERPRFYLFSDGYGHPIYPQADARPVNRENTLEAAISPIRQDKCSARGVLVRPQNGVHAGLIAGSLGPEPVEDFRIDSERNRRFTMRS